MTNSNLTNNQGTSDPTLSSISDGPLTFDGYIAESQDLDDASEFGADQVVTKGELNKEFEK